MGHQKRIVLQEIWRLRATRMLHAYMPPDQQYKWSIAFEDSENPHKSSSLGRSIVHTASNKPAKHSIFFHQICARELSDHSLRIQLFSYSSIVCVTIWHQKTWSSFLIFLQFSLLFPFFGGLQVSPVAVVMEPTELWLGISGHFQVEKHGKKKTGKTGTPWNTMGKKQNTYILFLEF